MTILAWDDVEETDGIEEMPPILDGGIGEELGVGTLTEEATPLREVGTSGRRDATGRPTVRNHRVDKLRSRRPRAPYSTWNIVSLALCTILLAVIGMMMYDLMRNMWSWNGAFSLNSSLMDMILGR